MRAGAVCEGTRQLLARSPLAFVASPSLSRRSPQRLLGVHEGRHRRGSRRTALCNHDGQLQSFRH